MDFSKAGRATYLSLTEAAFRYNLITYGEYSARRSFLDAAPDAPDAPGWPGPAAEAPPDDRSDPELGEAGSGSVTCPSNAYPPTVAFQPSAPSVHNWFFRPGDPDPQPSIPHGHWLNRSQPKLDAYTGEIWSKKPARPTGERLRRAEIAALWNDPAFRQMAKTALIHMLNTHPNAAAIISARGVRRPLRLPRKR